LSQSFFIFFNPNSAGDETPAVTQAQQRIKKSLAAAAIREG
jgi:hypothetical protein